MASSPPLPTTDEEDEDNVIGRGNFQRAYIKGGRTSPKGTSKEKDGFFNRLSGKALDFQKKKNAQLEQQISALKTELQKEIQKRLDQQRKLHSIITDCNNIQLGNGNSMTILQYDPDMEDPIPLMKQLMKITMEANDEIVNKLTLSENKLAKNSKYLQRIHSVVLQLKESGSSGTESHMIEQLKDMVEIPTRNDDFYSLEKAFDSLKADETTKTFEDLSSDAKRGIRIIVYKFGQMTRRAFANELGLLLEKQRTIGEEFVDENSCASIILYWLKIHGNNISKLLSILKEIENQLIKDSMQDLKEHTFTTCLDTSEKDIHFQSDNIMPISLHRTRRIGDSVLSLKSNRSDVSETLEMIERHASESLQKTADCPHIKPDVEALLCAMYTLQMDNSRTLQTIKEKINASDNKVKILVSEEKSSETDRKSSATEDGENREGDTSEKYV